MKLVNGLKCPNRGNNGLTQNNSWSGEGKYMESLCRLNAAGWLIKESGLPI